MNINNIKIFGAAVIMLLTFGCTDEFEEINTNPNKITVGDIKAYAMFEPLLYGSASAWQNYTWYWNNELIQFTAFTGGTTRQEHRYFISDANWASLWNKYAGLANNAIHMYDLSVEQENDALKAISITMKVLFMSNLTDMFGDIPYSEAFAANKENGTTKPKFDSQKDVYTQMFNELETANNLYATEPIFDKSSLDGMYEGSMEKWRKFNNSLYLRLLCRVSNRNEMNVGEKMLQILETPATYPIFESNEDNATVKFTGVDSYRNYFATTTVQDLTSSGRKLAEQFIKMTLITDESESEIYKDPRLPIIGQKKDNVNFWKGTVAGCTEGEQAEADAGASWLNHYVFCRPEAPTWFMDYAELQFIFAESALNGLIPGGETTAKDYYVKAVSASLEKWGEQGIFCDTVVTISSDDVVKFLDSELASWDNADSKEELIANQKYLALFWTGMEAYHEYRRTGFPILTIGEGTVYNDYVLPTRFAYPTITMATNSFNANKALERMGGDNTMKTPVWWSKQAIQERK